MPNLCTLLLQRHGIAVDGADDPARTLSAAGSAAVAAAAAGLLRCGWRLPRILHSPYRRAAQTAELMRPLLSAELASGATALVPCTALAPRLVGDGAAAVTQALSDVADAEVVLLVSHLPVLLQLLEHWCPPAQPPPSVAPGQVACLHFAHGIGALGAQLRWSLPTEALAAGEAPARATSKGQ